MIVALAVSKEGKPQEGSDRQLKQANFPIERLLVTSAASPTNFASPLQLGYAAIASPPTQFCSSLLDRSLHLIPKREYST